MCGRMDDSLGQEICTSAARRSQDVLGCELPGLDLHARFVPLPVLVIVDVQIADVEVVFGNVYVVSEKLRGLILAS